MWSILWRWVNPYWKLSTFQATHLASRVYTMEFKDIWLSVRYFINLFTRTITILLVVSLARWLRDRSGLQVHKWITLCATTPLSPFFQGPSWCIAMGGHHRMLGTCGCLAGDLSACVLPSTSSQSNFPGGTTWKGEREAAKMWHRHSYILKPHLHPIMSSFLCVSWHGKPCCKGPQQLA